MPSSPFGRLLAFVVCLLASSCENAPTATEQAPPRLRVAGTQVIDPNGEPIVLRGYSWGDWGLDQPSDGEDNVAQGANSVRIPLRWWGEYRDGVDSYDEHAPGHIDPAHLAMLDATIERAIAAHLWVVLFVDSNGGQGAADGTDNFWTNATMREQFFEVWEFVLERYSGREYIGAWELLPEPMPIGVSDDDVRAFYEALIPRVRAIDPRTPIVVGPNLAYNIRHLEAAYTTVDANIIYTGNYFIFDEPLNRIDDLLAFRDAHQVPVWINQVGIESGDDDALGKARKVLAAFRDADVGFAWWTYRSHTMNQDRHGIYYFAANGTDFVLKPEWLALVDEFMP